MHLASITYSLTHAYATRQPPVPTVAWRFQKPCPRGTWPSRRRFQNFPRSAGTARECFPVTLSIIMKRISVKRGKTWLSLVYNFSYSWFNFSTKKLIFIISYFYIVSLSKRINLSIKSFHRELISTFVPRPYKFSQLVVDSSPRYPFAGLVRIVTSVYWLLISAIRRTYFVSEVTEASAKRRRYHRCVYLHYGAGDRLNCRFNAYV